MRAWPWVAISSRGVESGRIQAGFCRANRISGWIGEDLYSERSHGRLPGICSDHLKGRGAINCYGER